MRASVIIPAYNAEKTLGACLDACLAQAGDGVEILVVDDGSTDGTAAIVKARPGIGYHYQPNAGPATARNTGARLTSGDAIVFTDADCIPAPGWLDQLLAGFTPGVVAVGGTYAAANPESRLARVIQAEIAARHATFGDTVDFLGSFNVAYDRKAFEAAGGFNETYRQASGEDNDLAYRLIDGGGKLRFTGRAVVAHYHPERLLPYLRTQARHGYWRVRLYRDHPARATGDQYAGWPDLLAPPLGLALPVLLTGLTAAGMALDLPGTAALGGLGLVLVYFALHLPLAGRLQSRLAPGDLLYFLLVASLRDLARGAGLLKGFWAFGLRQRKGN